MKLRQLATAALTAGALAFMPSSAQAGIVDGAWTYAKDRFHDALDIVRVRVGFPEDGKGLGAKVRATSLVQAGYVFFSGTYVGMDRRGIGITNERRREMGVSLFYGSMNRMEAVYGNGFLKANTGWTEVADRRILRNLPHWDDGRQRHLSFGAEIATPLFAIDVGVYPEEILDFALGFLTIDIYNDDELFRHDLRYHKAATLPGADSTAPFKNKRLQMEEDRLRIIGQSGDFTEDAPASETDAAAPAAVTAEDMDSIAPADADAAMEALDAQPAPADPTLETSVTPVDEGAVEEAAPDEAKEEPARVIDRGQDIRFRGIRPSREERKSDGGDAVELKAPEKKPEQAPEKKPE